MRGINYQSSTLSGSSGSSYGTPRTRGEWQRGTILGKISVVACPCV